MSTDVNKPKGKLQKTCEISAAFCLILLLTCTFFLYKAAQELGMSDPITASWLAGMFFFFFTGGALMLLSKANIPSFKFED